MYRFTLSESGHRDADDRRADVRTGVPRGDPVHRRPALPAPGHGAAHRRATGAGRDRLLEHRGLFSQEIHFGWQTPVAVGHPRRGRGRPQGRRRRSCSPTTPRARAWTAARWRCPGDQDQLIEAVAGANRHTVVVLNTGGPVLMPWLQDVAGVLETWYPGQQFGDAIAAVLFGDANPSGRLPVTFPASDTQGPAPTTQPQHYPGVNGVEHYDEGLDVGYRWYDTTGQRPLFPFGYGLSYEQFQVSHVFAAYDRHRGEAFVAAAVRNVSHRPGPATLELYLQSPPAAGEPPKQLKGYASVNLAPGQSRLVFFRLAPSDLAYFNQSSGTMERRPGPLHRARRHVLDRARSCRPLRGGRPGRAAQDPEVGGVSARRMPADDAGSVSPCGRRGSARQSRSRRTRAAPASRAWRSARTRRGGARDACRLTGSPRRRRPRRRPLRHPGDERRVDHLQESSGGEEDHEITTGATRGGRAAQHGDHRRDERRRRHHHRPDRATGRTVR